MTNKVHFRSRTLLTLFLLLAIFAASGCLRRRQIVTTALPLSESLPQEWTPLKDVQEVNIDGDSLNEYLLLFVYDNGPIGAVIYDPQVDDLPGSPDNSGNPNQPSTAMEPYAILPSYRPGAGQGFIAEPGQQENIGIFLVNSRPTAATGQTSEANMLILRGGATHLTFAWWLNKADGYGVHQIYAPGGFEGIDWDAWSQSPGPITSLTGVYPLHNRSLFCRRQRFDLVNQADAADPVAPVHIAYVATDLGVQFCGAIPPHPFYPEAVVLAYLLAAPNDLLHGRLQGATAQARLQQILQRDRLLYVNDLSAYTTMPLSGSTGSGPTYTTVCADLIQQSLPTDQPASVNGAPPIEHLWLLFELEHQPPHLSPPTQDQLLITNVNALPAPEGVLTVNCTDMLSG